MPTTRKSHTRALLRLFQPGQEDALRALLDAAVEAVDGYLTSDTDECVFDEPAFKNVFNYDLSGFLKWERLGKSEQDTPRLRNLLTLHKTVMGNRIGGHPSVRNIVGDTIMAEG